MSLKSQQAARRCLWRVRWCSLTTLPLPTRPATCAGGQAASSQLRAPGGRLVAGRMLGDAQQRRAAGRRLQRRQPRGQVPELVCVRAGAAYLTSRARSHTAAAFRLVGAAIPPGQYRISQQACAPPRL